MGTVVCLIIINKNKRLEVVNFANVVQLCMEQTNENDAGKGKIMWNIICLRDLIVGVV